MSEQQQKLFLAWHKQFPVSPRERLLHDRTAAIMGHQNPYVTGTKTWQLGKASQDNVTANRSASPPAPPSTKAPIKANMKSKVYHLSHCPSYIKVSDKNVREFYSEQLAIDAGFRRAGNCK
jgi:deoxyribonuclease-1